MSPILECFKHLNIPTNMPLAVAVSGGIDSLAVALGLLQFGYNPVGLIVNHGLRSISTEHAIKTKNILQNMNIESFILEWKHGPIGKNIEEQARKNRYELLTKKCNELAIKYLFLGHHANDQIETFLLNLSRGSGIDGLCGMPTERKLNGINLIRPFLGVEKKDLQLFLEQNSVQWLEDETNANDKFMRNKLRKIMQNLLPDLYKKRILLAVNNLQQTKEILDRHYDNLLKRIVVWSENMAVFLHKEYILLLTSERTWLLNAILMRLTNSNKKFRLSQIKNVDNNIFKMVKKSTLAGCEFTVSDSVVVKLIKKNG